MPDELSDYMKAVIAGADHPDRRRGVPADLTAREEAEAEARYGGDDGGPLNVGEPDYYTNEVADAAEYERRRS